MLCIETGDFIEIFGDTNIYQVYSDDYGNPCISREGKEVKLSCFINGIYCKYKDEDVANLGFTLHTPKIDGVVEGDYISVYCDGNIYYVYSELGRLYIDFRGNKTYLDTFGEILYKGYKDEEFDKVRSLVEL